MIMDIIEIINCKYKYPNEPETYKQTNKHVWCSKSHPVQNENKDCIADCIDFLNRLTTD